MQAEEQDWLRHVQRAVDALDGGARPGFSAAPADEHAERALQRHRTETNEGVHDRPRPPVSHGAVLGILWAIDDHPALAAASAAAVCNAVRATGSTRFAPWAVLDCVAKGTTVPAVKDALLGEIPPLLVACLPPVLSSASQHAASAASGSEDQQAVMAGADAASLGVRVLEVLRTWQRDEDLRYAVVQCGDRLRYELHITAAGGDSLVSGSTANAPTAAQLAVKSELSSSLATVGGGGSGGGGAGGSAGAGSGVAGGGLDILKKEAIARVLQAIAPVQASSGTAAGATGGAGANEKASDATGARLVAQVAAATKIDYHTSHACDMCGLYLDSQQAKQRHSRVHFFWRVNQDEQFVRLAPLDMDQLLRYDCAHSDGAHVPTIALPSEVSSVSQRAADRLNRKLLA